MDSLIEHFNTNSGFLKSKDISSRNQWRELSKMLNDSSVSKIKRGLYRLSDYPQDNSFIEVSNIVPGGIFCMFSAWFYYHLTTTIPHENHIAVSQHKKIQLLNYPPVKLYYFTDKFLQMGITQIEIDNWPVKIYDIEKSVCDAVRFRNKVGMDIAIEVVKNYVQRKDRDFNKLTNYACPLRIEKVMRNMIMPML